MTPYGTQLKNFICDLSKSSLSIQTEIVDQLGRSHLEEKIQQLYKNRIS